MAGAPPSRPLVLQDRESVLQQRIDLLIADVSDERKHRRLAEERLESLRQLEPMLVRRTTPEVLEQSQAAVVGMSAALAAEEMAELREDRERQILRLESELEELRNDSDARYQNLVWTWKFKVTARASRNPLQKRSRNSRTTKDHVEGRGVKDLFRYSRSSWLS